MENNTNKETLAHWRRIALLLNENNENSKAVKFIDRRIKESPKGAEEKLDVRAIDFLALLIKMSFEEEY